MIGPRWRGPFADPRFRRLLAGRSLSTFGDTALYLTLGIWAKALTNSNAAAGTVFLALGLPALFAPTAGHLADRIRRRPLLLWANALTAGLVLSLLAVRSQAELRSPRPRPRRRDRSAGRSRQASGTCERCRCWPRSRR